MRCWQRSILKWEIWKAAKSYADTANGLDSRNLDASRLQKKIDRAISDQKIATSNDTK